jgi:hypothetical protein
MVTPKYLALGFALLYFALGNCIYFFGRSHEMNLFSIAIPLIFLMFYTLDLVDRWMCHKDNTHTLPLIRNLAFVLAFFFILVAAYSCADRIKINLAIIYKNALALQAHPGDPFAETSIETMGVIQEIRQVIGNSGRIHFMISDESREFLFYQVERGNDAFFYPFSSWVFLKELIRFAQDKLDRGDYLLVDKKNEKEAFVMNLVNLGFSYQTKNGAYILLAHQNPSVVKN